MAYILDLSVCAHAKWLNVAQTYLICVVVAVVVDGLNISVVVAAILVKSL